jgi:DNA-binding MarR family transcriptional regulator
MEPMGFITVSRAGDDGRRRQVALTARGLVIARDLEEFYEDRVRRVLRELPPRQQRRLVRAMQSIIDILEQDPLTNFLATLRK